MFKAHLFKDKVALVTGGGSGIGYAIAEQLLKLDARVFIASRKEERLKAAVENLRASGPCEYFVCDIRVTSSIHAMAEAIKEKAGTTGYPGEQCRRSIPRGGGDISLKTAGTR